MAMTPRVVDISHYCTIVPDGMKKAAQAGIWGVITKATQGLTYVDPTLDWSLALAREAKLLTGVYHFADNSDVKKQLDHALKTADLSDDMLFALDYEDNGDRSMSPSQMVEFLERFEQTMGYKAILYSGNRIKDTIGKLSDYDQKYVCEHKLWLAHYNANYVLPKGFTKLFLHQYTGDGVGPEPHWVDGIKCPGNKGIDLNAYVGTREQLHAEWARPLINTQSAPIVAVANTQPPVVVVNATPTVVEPTAPAPWWKKWFS